MKSQQLLIQEILKDDDIETKISSINQKYNIELALMKSKRNEMIDEIKNSVKEYIDENQRQMSDEKIELLDNKILQIKDFFKDREKEIIKLKENAIQKALDKIKSPHKILAVGVFLALVTAAASKVYQLHKDKSLVCDEKKGVEKDDCLLKIRKKALEEKLKYLKMFVTRCHYAKDRVKCAKELDRKIKDTKEFLAKTTKEILTTGGLMSEED